MTNLGIGDICRLKSGSPNMLLLDISLDWAHVTLGWFDGIRVQEIVVHPSALGVVKKSGHVHG